MITNNVIQRVFYIKNKSGTGTAFIIDIDKKQYFITAKHVIDNLNTGSIIELFYQNDWQPFLIKLVGHHPVADVSVFVIEHYIEAFEVIADSNGIAYGQDLYFLGFPYGFKGNIGERNRHFPLPLVKKGILSCIFFDDRPAYMLIDGHNNPGFSGGPVVFKTANSQDFKIAGIISGFYLERENGLPVINSNSGIIIAYDITVALELIKSNPIGLTVPK